MSKGESSSTNDRGGNVDDDGTRRILYKEYSSGSNAMGYQYDWSIEIKMVGVVKKDRLHPPKSNKETEVALDGDGDGNEE